jgi:hypothetical protein
MNLSDHPGYMAGTNGAIAHHGDWPAYPFDANEGLLVRLSAFASGSKFRVIDDIDRAVLFVAEVAGTKLNSPFLSINFHIAGWHKDLLKLQQDGMISGIKPVSEYRWQCIQWKNQPRAWFEANGINPDDDDEVFGNPIYLTVDGVRTPFHPPAKGDAQDDEPILSWPEFPQNNIVVTQAGREWIHASLVKDWSELEEHSSPRAVKLFNLGFYDTCVREACVELEWSLKKALGSMAYGDKLVEAYFEHLAAKNWFVESVRRTRRQDLRMVFKLIRNRFMHVLADIDQTSALVNLIRIARVRSFVVTGDRSND